MSEDRQGSGYAVSSKCLGGGRRGVYGRWWGGGQRTRLVRMSSCGERKEVSKPFGIG